MPSCICGRNMKWGGTTDIDGHKAQNRSYFCPKCQKTRKECCCEESFGHKIIREAEVNQKDGRNELDTIKS